MAVSVLVPLRADGAERDRAWAYLSGLWAGLGWEVITGACPPGPWVKALAVADALSRASGDVLVIADADAWCPGVVAAVEAVESGAPWAVPHTLVHRLTKGATACLCGTEVFGGPLIAQRVEQRPYVGMVGGGCTVLRRDVYESCPLDPRFVGWGQEDAAWGVALTALHGVPWRSPEPLWHLWHPPADRLGLTAGMAAGEGVPPRGTGSLAGRRLLGEYARAADEGRMSEFLALREVEATREPTMWKYRNRGSGDIYEFLAENKRLSDLSGPDGNWDLIEQPVPQPLRDDDFRRTITLDPRPVETVNLPAPAPAGYDNVTAVLSGPEYVIPADDSDLTARPPVRASVEEWRSYGRTAGLGDRVDGMTKAQLVEHYKP